MWNDIVATAIGIVLSISGAVSGHAAQITAELRNAFMPAQSEVAKERAAAATSLPLLPDPKDSTKWAEITPPPSLFALAPGAAVAGQATATPASSDNASPAQTIINQPIIERTIERVVEVPATGYVTQSQLLSEIAALKSSFGTQLYGPSYPAPPPTANDGGLLSVIGMMGRIDHLSGTDLDNITVDGVSGLTDADIPDGITASNYLPLTGGTLTGDLTMSGTLTAGSLSVAGISSSGALIGPYVQATSTTATSTFAAALAIGTTTATAQLSIQQLASNNFLDLYDSTGVKQSDIRLQGSGTLGSRGIALNTPGVTGEAGSVDNQIVFRFNGATNKILFSADNTASAINTGSGHPLYFRAGNTTFSTSTAHLAITTSGNIGIGTTSPGQLLSVAGDILGNNVIGSYFSATSTTATSTFAGRIAAGPSSGGATSQGPISVFRPGTDSHGTVDFYTIATGIWRAGLVGDGTNAFGIQDIGINAIPFSIRQDTPANTLAIVKLVGSSAIGGVVLGGGTASAKLDVTSNGTLPAAVFQSGNVGIASTTPWSKLSVTNTGSGPSFVVEDSTSPDTTPFLIDASGNVGIGTNAPTAALTVSGAIRIPTTNVLSIGGASSVQTRLGEQLDLQGSGDTYNGLAITNWSNTATGLIDFNRAHDATPGNYTVVVNGDELGALVFRGADGSAFRNAASISSQVDGSTISASSMPGRLTFSTSASGSVTPTERMRIDSSGNLGVATTSPWRTLSVTGTVGFDGLTSSTGAGSLCLDSNKQVVYNSASDNCLSSTRATKHDIAPLSLDDLDVVKRLEPVSFVYNEGDGRTRYGFIAEDTAAVDAHLATYNASGTVSGIDDRSILAIVVGAIRELYARVQEYFARTERLEERVAALEAQLAGSAAAAGAPNAALPQEAPAASGRAHHRAKR
jgi:hypothetical protein